MRYESLHNHTVISDGQQTHTELLATAERYGFGLIVFTDHDILPREKDMKLLERYPGPVQWEIGIEISAGWPTDLGGGPANLFHVLAFDIDRENSRLKEYCKTATEARLERMERTVANLQQQGFDIELDRCLELAGEGAAATPHLVRALLEKEENIATLRQLYSDMAQQAKQDEQVGERYKTLEYEYKDRGVKSLVYGLLLSSSAYVPSVYVPYLFYNDLDACVAMIRDAGGVAVLAHWPSVRETINEAALEKIVAAGRLDGLEVRSGFTANPTIDTDEQFLRDLATKYDKLITIGIDSHGEEDFSSFMHIEGLAERTVGLWDQVIRYQR